MTCVEAFAGTVAAVKPQSAFFERFGSAGVAVLERTLAGLREAGTLSLLDVKRGDIGSTMTAYAQAYLADDSPLRADAITVSPYLGYGSLRPALDLARDTGRGVFVLALTSNPEGASVQHARLGDDSVAGAVVAGATADNAGAARWAASGWSSAPPSARPCRSSASTSPASTGRCWLPASGRRAPGPRTCSGSSARRCRPCWRAAAVRSSAPGPDAAPLRRAARRTAGRMAEVTAGSR